MDREEIAKDLNNKLCDACDKENKKCYGCITYPDMLFIADYVIAEIEKAKREAVILAFEKVLKMETAKDTGGMVNAITNYVNSTYLRNEIYELKQQTKG